MTPAPLTNTRNDRHRRIWLSAGSAARALCANIVRNERSETPRSTAECPRCSIRPQPRCFRLGKIEGAADAPRYTRA
jgi:hypothetical protein